MFAASLKELQNKKNLLLISGGPDSVCLFHLLLRQKIPFACVHFNHHLRGEESDADQVFVENLCREFAVPLMLRDLYFTQRSAIQNLARQRRLAACFELQCSQGFSHVLMAHQQDDMIETHLMRRQRGAGVRGLASIRRESFLKNPHDKCLTLHVFRPLLDTSKEDIMIYLKENRLAFRLDSSNFAKKYLRNRVREEIVAKFSPQERFEVVKSIKDYQRQDAEMESRLTMAVEKYGSFVPSPVWAAMEEELQFRYFVHHMQKNGFHKQIEKRHFALACPDRVRLNLNGALFVKNRLGCYFRAS